MSTENLQQSMTDDDRAKFKRGAELLGHVQAGKLFDDYWVPIGDGLLAVRRTVMNVLHLKKASGGQYNHTFGNLCARTPYADMHKVERANLLYCTEHLSDIVEMRAAWTPTERAKINHPTSMAKRLREFLNRAPGEAPRRNATPMALLKDKNETLMRANLDLAERLVAAERNDGSLFDLGRDTAEDIVDVIARHAGSGRISWHKVESIAKGLAARAKQKKSVPAG